MFTDLTLHELAAQGDAKQIEAHIKHGKTASINQNDEDFGRRTPLHLAAQKGTYGIRDSSKLIAIPGFYINLKELII